MGDRHVGDGYRKYSRTETLAANQRFPGMDVTRKSAGGFLALHVTTLPNHRGDSSTSLIDKALSMVSQDGDLENGIDISLWQHELQPVGP